MIWKMVQIEHFEHYEVSFCGKLKNTKTGKLIEGWLSTQGYIRVALSNGKINRKFYLHRLVAIMHVDNPNNHPEVHHKDHVRTNCHAENLIWCEHDENMMYMWNRRRKRFDEIHSNPINKEKETDFHQSPEVDIPF